MDRVIYYVLDLLEMSVSIWTCSTSTAFTIQNGEGVMELYGYIDTYKENNPIISRIQYAGPNLLIMVATFPNKARQKISL